MPSISGSNDHSQTLRATRKPRTRRIGKLPSYPTGKSQASPQDSAVNRLEYLVMFTRATAEPSGCLHTFRSKHLHHMHQPYPFIHVDPPHWSTSRSLGGASLRVRRCPYVGFREAWICCPGSSKKRKKSEQHLPQQGER